MSEPRYFRCTACRAKWHHLSLEYRPAAKPRTSLLDIENERGKGGCPACGGDLKPAKGLLEEEHSNAS